MATYKLIQDIEAEDHILGPLSLRQFLFALGAAVLYYLSFFLYTKGGAFLLVATLPPAFLLTFFAFPFGKDQPTEVWALAKIRFLFKPRKRVWDQSGMKELVTITVPKKIERVLTNGLDQDQVKSRLNALANTIDSRGWAIKNVDASTYTTTNQVFSGQTDRLVSASSLPQAVPNDDNPVTASEDILDTTNNPVAAQFDQMILQSAHQHHQDLINQMNTPAAPLPQPAPAQTQQQAPPADYWFMQQQEGATAAAPTYQPVLPQAQSQSATPEEEAIAAHARERNESQQVYNSNLRTIQPIDPFAAVTAPVQQIPQQANPIQDDIQATVPAVTEQPDPAILNLANNNDLNVATIAREASKAKQQDLPHDEVVVSLR